MESYFKDKRIDHVYISDLTRTQETYRYIFPYDIPSTVTSLLRERSLGVFEGEYNKLMQDKSNIIVTLTILNIKIFVIVSLKSA